MQQKKLQRICVYPKDIQIITGKSYRQSLRIYHQIKRHYNKKTSSDDYLEGIGGVFGDYYSHITLLCNHLKD